MKRIERGWAGHFCMGVECNWRRNTLIEDKGRYIVVSSVGALPVRDKNGNRTKFQEIGFKRYYETMIFVGHEDGIFIEADVTKQRYIEDMEWCISREPDGKTDLEAEEIHEKNVQYVMEHFNEVYSDEDMER